MKLQILKNKEKETVEKKVIEMPEIEFIPFDANDVITTSGDWKKDTELEEI